MAWYKDPVLEGDEVSANTKYNCCLVTLVLGTIITGVMLKIMSDPGTWRRQECSEKSYYQIEPGLWMQTSIHVDHSMYTDECQAYKNMRLFYSKSDGAHDYYGKYVFR